MQLELIPKSKEEIILEEIKELKTQLTNVRKGLFARNAELAKHYLELKHEFEILKSALCKQKLEPDHEKKTLSISSLSLFNLGSRSKNAI